MLSVSDAHARVHLSAFCTFNLEIGTCNTSDLIPSRRKQWRKLFRGSAKRFHYIITIAVSRFTRISVNFILL